MGELDNMVGKKARSTDTAPKCAKHEDAVIVFRKGKKELGAIRTAAGWNRSDAQVKGFRDSMSEILKNHGANLVGADTHVYDGKDLVGGFTGLDRMEVTPAGWSKFSREVLDYISGGAAKSTSATR